MSNTEEDAALNKDGGNVQNGQQVAQAETETSGEPEKEQRATEQPKRWLFNLKFFVAIVCLVMVVMLIETFQRFAVLTTLERRFGFTSTQSGIIMASYDVGHLSVLLLLSIIGHKIHQPRMCGLGGIFSCIASLLWLAPHVIFGPGTSMDEDPETIELRNSTELLDHRDVDKCFLSYDPNRTLDGYCVAQEAARNATATNTNQVETWVSFAFFFAAQTMLGAALAPFLTVDFTYIDDNTDPQTSAFSVGIVLSLGSLGCVLGFLLGAFTLGFPIGLQATTFTQADPEWIGAWWLGSVITAVLMIIVCFPLFFFPRSLVHRHKHQKVYSKEDDGKEHTQAEEFHAVTVKDEQLQEIPKKSKPLIKNVVFICATVAMSTVNYLQGGVYIFLPKYYEVQFGQRPVIANVITSFVTAGAMAAGTFAGGYIASYFELDRRGNAKMIVITVTMGVVLLIVTMLLGCEQQQFAGNIGPGLQLNASLPCNFNCTCGMEFSPVCGEDNLMYYSACHAGCKDIVSATGETMTYANCSCLVGEGAPLNGTAVSGPCDLGCKMIIPYSILTFICNFCVFLAASPFLAFIIRSVEPIQKALALGINNIATSIFGTIPAPMIYGALIDASCELYSPSCDAGQKSCILYTNNLFRFYMYGFTIVVISITDASIGVAWGSIVYEERKERKKAKSKEKDQPEAVPMVDKA